MAGSAGQIDGGRVPWRIIGWSVPVVLLLVPILANAPWTPSDFVVASVLFGIVGLAIELAVRASASPFYRAGVAVAILGAFLLFWINGAVGIIGDEGNPANLMYLGVIGVGAIGAIVAKARAVGMARAMAATAGAQALVAVIALAAGLGASEPPGPWGILLLNGGFVALFVGSAWLFQRAARTISVLSVGPPANHV